MMTGNTEPDQSLQVFSRRLESKLSDFGWTQREFASRLKINESRVSNWMQGRNGPRGEMRAKVAALLQVDSRWLLGEDTEYTNPDLLMVEEGQGSYGNHSNNSGGQFPRSPVENLKRIQDFMSPWLQAAQQSSDIASHLLIQLKLHLPHKDLDTIREELENE